MQRRPCAGRSPPWIDGVDPAASLARPDLGQTVTRPGVRVTVTYSFSTHSGFSWKRVFSVAQTQTLTRTVDMRLVPLTVN